MAVFDRKCPLPERRCEPTSSVPEIVKCAPIVIYGETTAERIVFRYPSRHQPVSIRKEGLPLDIPAAKHQNVDDSESADEAAASVDTPPEAASEELARGT